MQRFATRGSCISFAAGLLALTALVTPACGSDNGTHAVKSSDGGEAGETNGGGKSGGGKNGGGSANGGTGNVDTGGSTAVAGDGSVAGEGPGGGTSGSGGTASQAGAPGDGGAPTGDAGAGGISALAGAGGAAPEPCTGPARCLSDSVAAVCPESGVLQTLECTNGCVQSGCAQTDLSTGWLLHQFSLSNDAAANASYAFSQNGLSALQSQNSMPSVYYLDRDLEGVEITGSFAVETTGDDDMIGFVFGMQDTEHFYLFDWKQLAQSDGTCGNAEMGATLKLISGSAELTDCKDFWQSTASTSMQVLVPTSANTTGWLDDTVYTFALHYKPGDISIVVKNGADTVVSLSSNDATYTHGRFGFYNYSQASSRYEFFQFQPAE